ncbi:MAG TPA: hypothetical protein VEF53_20680 [Patescibacteria group bacterium]|nr:hypothetical protein [Patescibacteria group bacterium]
MPIRSIDYQTMIPKAPEVQKIKHAEMQNPQNNNAINMHQEQQQNERNLKKVNETKKAFEGKIKRDNPKKQQQNSKDQEEENEKQHNKKKSIDIRI